MEAMLGFERLGLSPRSDEYCWREQALWRSRRRLGLVRRCGERTKPDSIIMSMGFFLHIHIYVFLFFRGFFAVLVRVGGVLFV